MTPKCSWDTAPQSNPVPNPRSTNIYGLPISPHLFLLMAPLLKRVGPRRYTIPSPLGAGLGDSDLVVLVDTVRLYLEYDGHLRAGTASLNATPFGYNDFALAFNMQPAALVARPPLSQNSSGQKNLLPPRRSPLRAYQKEGATSTLTEQSSWRRPSG